MVRSMTGRFPSREEAEAALADLRAAGFDASYQSDESDSPRRSPSGVGVRHTRGTGGAIAGAVIGAVVGIVLVVSGLLAVPGIGHTFPYDAVVAGLVGAAAGWLIGAAAVRVRRRLRRRRQQHRDQQPCTLAVDAQSNEAEARAILLRNGATDLSDAAQRGTGAGQQAANSSGQQQAAASPAQAIVGAVAEATAETAAPVVDANAAVRDIEAL